MLQIIRKKHHLFHLLLISSNVLALECGLKQSLLWPVVIQVAIRTISMGPRPLTQVTNR